MKKSLLLSVLFSTALISPAFAMEEDAGTHSALLAKQQEWKERAELEESLAQKAAEAEAHFKRLQVEGPLLDELAAKEEQLRTAQAEAEALRAQFAEAEAARFEASQAAEGKLRAELAAKEELLRTAQVERDALRETVASIAEGPSLEAGDTIGPASASDAGSARSRTIRDQVQYRVEGSYVDRVNVKFIGVKGAPALTKRQTQSLVGLAYPELALPPSRVPHNYRLDLRDFEKDRKTASLQEAFVKYILPLESEHHVVISSKLRSREFPPACSSLETLSSREYDKLLAQILLDAMGSPYSLVQQLKGGSVQVGDFDPEGGEPATLSFEDESVLDIIRGSNYRYAYMWERFTAFREAFPTETAEILAMLDPLNRGRYAPGPEGDAARAAAEAKAAAYALQIETDVLARQAARTEASYAAAEAKAQAAIDAATALKAFQEDRLRGTIEQAQALLQRTQDDS